MKNETIMHIQNKIEQDYPSKILHILNGLCMLEDFRENNLMSEKAVYIPFNEAMCWGEVEEEIFSLAFIKKRAHSLKSTPEEYEKIVIEPLAPFLNEHFDTIVLWFGDDMFCQINFITLLSYLEKIDFKGNVLFCMKQEQKHEMASDVTEINLGSYSAIYKTVLCDKEKCGQEMLPVTYQAMNLYLHYKEEDSDISRYITSNLNKKNLIKELLELFPQYGLGDAQYMWMIEDLKKGINR